MKPPHAYYKLEQGAKPIVVLCLGHVVSFYKAPMSVETGWAVEKPLNDMLMENDWACDKVEP